MKNCRHCGAPLADTLHNNKYCSETCAGEIKAEQDKARRNVDYEGPPTAEGWDMAWAAAEVTVKASQQRMIINPAHGKRGQPLYILDRRQQI